MPTTSFALTNAGFVDCGVTPAIVSMKGGAGAYVAFGASLPAANASGHTLMSDGHQFMQVPLAGQHVYARAISANATIIVSN